MNQLGTTLPIPAITLKGVRLHRMTESECVRHVLDELDAGRGGWVVTANLDHLRRLVRDQSYVALCREATLVVADGMPLVWASRLQRTPLPERVAGSNLIWSLTEGASRRGRRVFLLGGTEGTAARTGEIFQSRFPDLRLAGVHFPPFGFERDANAIQTLKDALSEAKPDIIYVALGSPKQEQLIARLRGHVPGAWWLGVGISFSFIAGEVRRAPRWMQRCGLEWVHRLGQEPRRLMRRYLIDDLPFGVSLLASAAGRRLSGGGRSDAAGVR